MVGTLDRLIERLPIVPMIGSGRQPLLLTHVDDLAKLSVLCLTADSERVPAIITAAWPIPVLLKRILRKRAAERGRSPALLPVPWHFIWLALKVPELLGIDIGLRSDSVIGFIYSDQAPHFDDTGLAAMGFSGFRPFIQA